LIINFGLEHLENEEVPLQSELSLPALPLSSRQSTSISAYALCNNVEGFARDDVILISCHGRSNYRHLSLGRCSGLLDDHASYLILSARAARCEPHHPKRHNVLRVNAELNGFESQSEPRI
jgi:hypothetical protein